MPQLPQPAQQLMAHFNSQSTSHLLPHSTEHSRIQGRVYHGVWRKEKASVALGNAGGETTVGKKGEISVGLVAFGDRKEESAEREQGKGAEVVGITKTEREWRRGSSDGWSATEAEERGGRGGEARAVVGRLRRRRSTVVVMEKEAVAERGRWSWRGRGRRSEKERKEAAVLVVRKQRGGGKRRWQRGLAAKATAAVATENGEAEGVGGGRKR